MNVITNPSGVKVYHVSIGKSMPEWISQKKKKALNKDEGLKKNLPNPKFS
jgi:ribosome biogenesis protein ENP2